MSKRHSVEFVRRRLGVVVGLALGALALAGCLPAAPAQLAPTARATPAPTEQAALPTAAPAPLATSTPIPTPVPTPVPTLAPTTAAGPVAEPKLPPGLVLPTATPAFPEQAIAPDSVAALRMLRTIGYGTINDTSAAPAARLLAAATSAGVALFELPAFRLLRFTPGEARRVLLSPDGQRMLVDDRLISTADGKALGVIRSQQARFSFDSQLIAGSMGDQTTIWRSADGKLLWTFSGTQAAFSPDSSLVAVTTKTDIRIVRVADGVVGRILNMPTDQINDLAFGAGADRLFAVLVTNPDNGAKVELQEWRVLDGQLIRTLPIVASDAYGPYSHRVILSPLGDLLAIAAEYIETPPGSFELFSTADGRRLDLASPGLEYDSNMSFSADGSAAVFWDDPFYQQDDALHLIDTRQRTIADLALPSIGSLTFSPDGQTLAGSTGLGAYTWRVTDGAPQQVLVADLQLPFGSAQGSMSAMQLRYSADGRRLMLTGDSLILFGDYGAQLVAWDTQSGAVTQRWEAYLAQLFAMSPSGQLCATLTTFDQGRIDTSYLLDLTRGITVPLELDALLSAAAFSPDGALLAVGDAAGAVRLLRADDGAPAGELTLGGGVLSLAFSPDGALLASQRVDGLVQVWRVGATQPLASMAAPPGDQLLISADNQLLISGGQAGVAFYRLETGQLLHRLDVAADDLAIGPRGRLLAISHAGQAQLWGIPSGGQ